MNQAPTSGRESTAPGGVCWLLGLAVLLAALPQASAQGPRIPFGQNTQAFRRILHNRELKPLLDRGQLIKEAEKSILIVLGDVRPIEPWPPGMLRDFVERGGSVLIATDRATAADRYTSGPSARSALERELRVEISGRKLLIDGKSSYAYRGNPECPVVIDLPSDNPIFGGLHRIATNRPSCIAEHWELPALAVFPNACQMQWKGIGLPANEINIGKLKLTFGRNRGYVFAAGGRLGRGRVLVLSDHSVFINDMLLKNDNSNLRFAVNSIDWLIGPEKRDSVLLYDEGSPVSRFDVSLEDVQPPPVRPFQILNRMIVGIEEDDAINRLILNHLSPTQIMAGAALLVTVLLAVFGYHRLERSRYALRAEASRRVGRALVAPSNTDLTEQRRQALLQTGNLSEPARELARHCLADLGYEPDTEQAGGGNDRPAFEVDGTGSERRRLTRMMDELWRLAAAPSVRPISWRQFQQAAAWGEAVKTAHLEGRLRLDGRGEVE